MTDAEKNFDGHFATRARAGAVNGLFALFPDPDPILKRKGIGISALRNLLTDEHLEAVSGVRAAAVSGSAYHLTAGGDGSRESAALALCAENFDDLNVSRVVEELMECVFYGYKPAEILWKAAGGKWLIDDIVGKPSEWFAFDDENTLVFKGRGLEAQALPDNKFLCAQHRASYDNPYGQKAYSKCFWPVVFKRSGWQWWTTFVEKYAGVLAIGHYPQKDEKLKDEILEMLEKMVADAVGVVPDGTEVELKEAAGKGVASQVYAQYLEAADNAISKAILGQTLTTQIGKNGSFAAAQVHDMVRQDLVKADKRRIAQLMTRALSWLTLYNFGPDVRPPRFAFDEPEDLKKEKAERDKLLYGVGVRFKPEHIAAEYNIPLEHFEIDASASSQDQAQAAAGAFGSSALLPDRRRLPRPGRLFSLVRSLFRRDRISPEERRIIKDAATMEEFRATAAPRIRQAAARNVETLLSRLASASDYDEAFELLAEAYPDLEVDELASAMDELRYMASQVGSRGAR